MIVLLPRFRIAASELRDGGWSGLEEGEGDAVDDPDGYTDDGGDADSEDKQARGGAEEQHSFDRAATASGSAMNAVGDRNRPHRIATAVGARITVGHCHQPGVMCQAKAAGPGGQCELEHQTHEVVNVLRDGVGPGYNVLPGMCQTRSPFSEPVPGSC
ncbi:MAG: hypothetical protein ACRDYY_01000 [Acidimicrobiales bacterium]